MGLLDQLKKDGLFVSEVFKALRAVTPMGRRRHTTICDAMEVLARRYGERPALVSDDETLSFRALNARANQYARWAMANGVGKGGVVGLLMPNRPEYVAIWLGVARAGGVTALLNTTLSGTGLARCINLVSPAHIIVAADLADSFESAAAAIPRTTRVWYHGGTGGRRPRIDQSVEAMSGTHILGSERPLLTLDDPCLYIYTSGTTGPPKAAIVSHYRVYGAMLAFATFMNMSGGDRNYDCLPMYHTSGGVLAIAGILKGASVFIREAFSARGFWDDIVDNGCTRFQYVGELCRFLVTAPVHPKEHLHQVALCCGNGLRPDVWERFKDRFRVPIVREFYAATEGNAVMLNWDGTPGAVGRVPRWARPVFPVTNIRIDLDRREPVRGEDGLCIECDPGEAGEVVSRVVRDPLRPAQRFDGYTDRRETERMLLRDVFVAGDLWFRTGDLMRRDRRGYFAFMDRIGDTIRWRGESVSPSEVAETLTACPGVDDALVYSVEITRTGAPVPMAVLAVSGELSLDTLYRHIHSSLAIHARPVLLRLRRTIDTTSTFRHRKLDLIRDGFDPTRSTDPIFLVDTAGDRLVRINPELHRLIHEGSIALQDPLTNIDKILTLPSDRIIL